MNIESCCIGFYTRKKTISNMLRGGLSLIVWFFQEKWFKIVCGFLNNVKSLKNNITYIT